MLPFVCAVAPKINAKEKNISYDASSATLTRGTEFIANISVNIAELIGK